MDLQSIAKSLSTNSTFKTAAIFGIGIAAGTLIKSLFYDDPRLANKIKDDSITFGNNLFGLINKIKYKHICTVGVIVGGFFIYRRIGQLENNITNRITNNLMGSINNAVTNNLSRISNTVATSLTQLNNTVANNLKSLTLTAQNNLKNEIKNTITQVLSSRHH